MSTHLKTRGAIRPITGQTLMAIKNLMSHGFCRENILISTSIEKFPLRLKCSTYPYLIGVFNIEYSEEIKEKQFWICISFIFTAFLQPKNERNTHFMVVHSL